MERLGRFRTGARYEAFALIIFAYLSLAADSPQVGPLDSPWGPLNCNSGSCNYNGPTSTGSPDSSNPYSANQAGYRAPATTPARRAAVVAHVVCAAGAMVIVFPWGAILLRVGGGPNIWKYHAAIQITGYLLYFVGLCLGLHILYSVSAGQYSPSLSELALNAHPALGIVIFVFMLAMPLLGWMHHQRFVQLGKRTAWSAYHRWGGRVIVTAGMVNGGLGLRWARQNRMFVASDAWVIVYASVVAMVYQVWLVAVLRAWKMRRAERRRREQEEALWSNSIGDIEP